MAATPSASSVPSVSSTFYEFSVCHGLAPDLETSLNPNCGSWCTPVANQHSLLTHGGWYLLKLLSVTSNLSHTERITSDLGMNRTNAKTCLSRGIEGLPNACCWGTFPVGCTSRHRASKVPRVILKWLLNSSMQAKYFHKNLYFCEDRASYRLQRQSG